MKKGPAYRVYLLLQAAVEFIFGVIFTLNMVYQITIAKLDPLQLVLVGTTLETTVFFLEVPTGVIADVYSRRLSIILGYFLIGLGFLLEGSVPLFATILLSQVLWGAGYTFTSGATEAWISDEIGQEAAGGTFLRGAQAGQMGALLGIGVSVLLGSTRVNIPILVGGGLFLLLAVILILVMPEQNFKPVPRQERSSWQSLAHTWRGGLNMLHLRPALLTIFAVGLFYGLYSEGYDRLWTKHLLDSFSLPPLAGLSQVAWFGLIRAVGILLAAAFTELVRRRLDTRSHSEIVRLLFIVTFVLAGGLLGYAWAGSFGVALVLVWLISVTRNVIGPVYTAWVNQRLDSSVRATVISMSSQMDAIGQIAGGPLVGVVGSLVSVRAALTLSGLLLAPVLGLFARAQNNTNPVGSVDLP